MRFIYSVILLLISYNLGTAQVVYLEHGKLKGTGFIIEDGYVLTCKHIVEPGPDVLIEFETGEQVKGKAVYTRDDFCLIQYTDKVNTPLYKLAKIPALRGQDVRILACHPDYKWSMIKGLIAHTNRTVELPNALICSKVIQLDAAIQLGYSGSPVLNTQEEVLGMVFAMDGRYNNIGFAFNATDIERFINEYKRLR